MALTLKAGELAHLWSTRCFECKRVHVLEGAVTALGAAHTLASQGWDKHPRNGWVCPSCRSTSKPSR